MASKPVSVDVRAYRVGFGDCFLVSFVYPRNDRRHVLIDFGCSKLPPAAKTRGAKLMTLIAEDIRKTCGGKLTAVVATHRHLDHINGFSTDGKAGRSGAIIASCRPKVVLQPWTEDPDAAIDAVKATRTSLRSRRSFVDGLAAMHRIAEAACRLAQSPGLEMRAAISDQLGFVGSINIKNPSAVRNLIAMGEAPGATPVWARHGSDSGLEPLLPGVKVHVLGPPDLTQSEKIRRMRASDPTEFWQLLSTPLALRGPAVPSPGAAKRIPPEARWFRDQLAKISGEQLLEIVRELDKQMNNTSLILLFEVGRRKLLFAGDAQIENWSYALQDAPDRDRTRKLLAGVDFYKVGHHGSRNATPRKLLWENFAKLGAGKKERLVTLLSTVEDSGHGSEDNQTEVPRTTLVEALEAETELHRTDKPRKGDPPLYTPVSLSV
jgi:hypothetical protein